MKIVFVFCLALVLKLNGYSQTTEIEKVKRFADSIQIVSERDFLFNRRMEFFPYYIQNPFNEFILWIDTLPYKTVEIWLEQDNPKIRALGLIGLYHCDLPNSIYTYKKFLNDSAICFKKNPFSRSINPYYDRNKTRAENDTLIKNSGNIKVSDIAKAILDHYLNSSGYTDFDNDLPVFLKERERSSVTAGFLKVMKMKATGRISPVPEERLPLILKFKKKIEQIKNRQQQALYKIYLSADDYQLYSDVELRNELKILGRNNVLSILRRKPPTRDPDLLNVAKSEIRNFEYIRMCQWILLNSDIVLTKKDINFLLDRAEIEETKMRSRHVSLYFPYWYIGCAKIDKPNASAYLKTALEHFDGEFKDSERAELYAELWHLSGVNQQDIILDWFFDIFNSFNDRGDYFIRRLNKKEDIFLLKAIVKDKRFNNSIKARDVIQIARQINALNKREIFPYQMIQDIWHPFGIESIEHNLKKALKEYPKETNDLLKNTDILKQAIKKVIDD